MSESKKVFVSGAFDDIKSIDLRFLEEASKIGNVTVILWSDSQIESFTGKLPKFPIAERSYFLNAVRYVHHVVCPQHHFQPDQLPVNEAELPDVWLDIESPLNVSREKYCRHHQIDYHVFSREILKGYPEPLPNQSAPDRKKVVATGCYDWFHSGHVRFTEEASQYGDLYLCLGNDANVELLKGKGHPLLKQDERRYVAGSIKFVKQALITTGAGWLDADPEIRRLKPDFYVVNEDGDKGGKREYCQKLGIEYLVLKRSPAPGLPSRSSTDLRGF